MIQLASYAHSFGYRLSSQVTGFHSEEGGTVGFTASNLAEATWRHGDARVMVVLEALQGEGSSHQALLDLLVDRGTPEEEAQAIIRRVVGVLASCQYLSWCFLMDARAVCLVESQSGRYCPLYRNETDQELLLQPLSRFACLRHDRERYLLDNAEMHAQLRFLDGQSQAAAGLFAPPASNEDWAFRHFLYCTGFLEPPGEEVPARAAWMFHDLLFHDATRVFHGQKPIGRGDRLAGKLPPPVRRQPASHGDPITMPTPEGSEAASPLQALFQQRRSLREPGQQALSLESLSTFLGRSLRAYDAAGTGQAQLPGAMPAGGGVYELTFYVAIRRCEGLEPGLYRYQGASHSLQPLPAPQKELGKLLTRAQYSMALPTDPPDSLIVIGARSEVLARTYNGIAYRLSLLHGGVAMQTLYLVATELGLSPCAIGTGDSSLAAQLTGMEAYRDTVIAEFALSGPPDHPATASERT